MNSEEDDELTTQQEYIEAEIKAIKDEIREEDEEREREEEAYREWKQIQEDRQAERDYLDELAREEEAEAERNRKLYAVSLAFDDETGESLPASLAMIDQDLDDLASDIKHLINTEIAESKPGFTVLVDEMSKQSEALNGWQVGAVAKVGRLNTRVPYFELFGKIIAGEPSEKFKHWLGRIDKEI